MPKGSGALGIVDIRAFPVAVPMTAGLKNCSVRSGRCLLLFNARNCCLALTDAKANGSKKGPMMGPFLSNRSVT
jgi:hypothetical protein